MGDIGLDDVEIVDGACPAQGSCDFETGYCGYSNEVERDDFDWQLGRGTVYYYTGPKVDHTTGTALGYYAYINPTGDISSGNLIYKIFIKSD